MCNLNLTTQTKTRCKTSSTTFQYRIFQANGKTLTGRVTDISAYICSCLRKFVDIPAEDFELPEDRWMFPPIFLF